MKRSTNSRSRRTRLAGALVAAALAASAAVIWGGTSAVATAMSVALSMPARPPQVLERPGETDAPARTQPAVASHQTHAPESPDARAAQKVPPGSDSRPGLGNRPEVSLEEAGRAEVGSAARSQNGHGRAGNLPKSGVATPGDVLGATPSLGGCLPEYGDAGQCLPSVPPSLSQHLEDMKRAGLNPASMPHKWTCGEVRQYFKNGLSVRQTGVDPQSLDSNSDGIACSEAD